MNSKNTVKYTLEGYDKPLFIDLNDPLVSLNSKTGNLVGRKSVREQLLKQGVPNDILIKNGFIDSNDSSIPGDNQLDLANAADWSMRNLDIVLPVATTAASSALALPTGGASVAGQVAANAGVAALGNYLSSQYKESQDEVVEEKLSNALEEGAVSAVTDILLLGLPPLGKRSYEIFKAFNFGGSEVYNLTKLQQKIEDLTDPELASLIRQQKILTEGGVDSQGNKISSTLSTFNSKRQNAFSGFMEKFAELGMLSSSRAQKRYDDAAQIISNKLTELVSKSTNELGKSTTSSLGTEIHTILKGGNDALISQYGESYEQLIKSMSSKQVDPTRIVNRLKAFKASKAKKRTSKETLESETYGYDVDEVVENKLNSMISLLESSRTIDLKALMQEHKRITSELHSYSSPLSGNFNKTIDYELTEVSKVFKEQIEKTLGEKDKGYGLFDSSDMLGHWQDLQKFYKEGKEALFPKINTQFINAADKGAYHIIGQKLIQNPNLDTLSALHKSIDKSFEVMKSSDIKGPIKTAQEAKDAIKNGYIFHQFKNIGTEEFEPKSMKAKLSAWKTPTQIDLHKKLFGEDYRTYQDLINTLSTIQEYPSGFMGSLIIRSREAKAVSAPASMGGALLASGTMAGVGGAVGDLATAAGFLFLPVVWQAVSASPKAVNRLLALEKNSRNKNYSPEFITSQVIKVFNTLEEEDKQDVRDFIRNQYSKVTLPLGIGEVEKSPYDKALEIGVTRGLAL